MRMFSRGQNATADPDNPAELSLMKRSISAYEVVNYFSREKIADILYQVSVIWNDALFQGRVH